MGIFNFFKNKKKTRPQPKFKVELKGYVNGVEVPLSDDVDDGENWREHAAFYQIVRQEIQPLEDVMIGFATTLKKYRQLLSVDEEIQLLESIIESYSALKVKCYSMGPDFVNYMDQHWEQARKNKPEGPGYIERYRERLYHLKENYSELKAKETLRNDLLKDLPEKVIIFLKEKSPILQTDIYKQFDPVIKTDLQNLLYELAQKEIIIREKQGRTYLISLKK